MPWTSSVFSGLAGSPAIKPASTWVNSSCSRYSLLDDLACLHRRRVVRADVIQQMQRLGAPSTVSASSGVLHSTSNGSASQARKRNGAVMNDSRLVIRSNTLFTSNDFGSRADVLWRHIFIGFPALEVMSQKGTSRLKSHYIAKRHVYNRAAFLLLDGIKAPLYEEPTASRRLSVGSPQPDPQTPAVSQGRNVHGIPCRFSVALGAITLLSGCSAFRNYDSELAQTNQQLASGNVDAALTLLERTTPARTRTCCTTSRKVSCCAPRAICLAARRPGPAPINRLANGKTRSNSTRPSTWPSSAASWSTIRSAATKATITKGHADHADGAEPAGCE